MKRILIILLIVLPIYILSCPVKAEIESSFNEYSSVLLVADVESGAMIDANQAAIDFYGFSREILISINGNHALSPISIVNDKASRKQLKETLRVRTVIFYIVLSIFAMLQFIVILMLARGLKANKKIHKTLTEIKDKYLSLSENTHEELICTAKQLAALNKLRDKLFTDVVHDIRNPIATMVSMMEVLEEDYCSSDSREIVREVRKQVKSTFSMVENLLECVNIQNDGLVQRDIIKIAQETVNVLRRNELTKEIRITKNIEEGVTIFADKEMLGMALQNFLNSAVKLSRSGGLISIQTHHTGQKVIATVRDTGIRIDPDKVKKLFSKAHISFTAGTAGEVGTGLGILICNEFIQDNEIEIWMDGIATKDSTIYFSLPSDHKVNST